MKRELVLCAEASVVAGEYRMEGFVPLCSTSEISFLRPEFAWFCPRHVVEGREEYRQLIPYVVLRQGNSIVTYRRTKGGGEARLHGKASIGFGGHVDTSDIAHEDHCINVVATISNAAEREVQEELSTPLVRSKRTIGLLNDLSNPVGRVHLGLVQLWEIDDGPVRAREDSLVEVELLELEKAMAIDDMENWSMLVLNGLKGIEIW